MSEDLPLFPTLPEQLAPADIRQANPKPVWTEHKAQVIARYLRYFVFITKHGCYIDGFAGPKNPGLSDSWAAKLVLESEPQWFRQFFLCDSNNKQIQHLQHLKADQPSKPKRLIEIRQGDFNQSIGAILSSGHIKGKTATFCLLDQYTAECEWSTLEKIARFKPSGENKIELLYFLGSGWINRALSGFTRNVDVPEKWWGKSDWRDIASLGPTKMALKFRERFEKELGYRYVSAWPIYQREGQGGKEMFSLIHASDHEESPKLMGRAYRNVLRAPEPEDQLILELGN